MTSRRLLLRMKSMALTMTSNGLLKKKLKETLLLPIVTLK